MFFLHIMQFRLKSLCSSYYSCCSTLINIFWNPGSMLQFGKHCPTILAFIYVISVITCQVTYLTLSNENFPLNIANLNTTQLCISTAPSSAQYVPGDKVRVGGRNLTNSCGISINSMFVMKCDTRESSQNHLANNSLSKLNMDII